MKRLFTYLDYRTYLTDFYEEQKSEKSYFTYRYMAMKVDMDHSLLVKVLAGKRNIALEYISKFIKLCKLQKKEADYFDSLVRFTRAKSNADQKLYFEKMLALKGVSSKVVDDFQYEFFNKWYYTAVRNALDYFQFDGDYKALGEHLNPSITAHEAKRAIRLLEKLKLIEKQKGNSYKVTNAHITAGGNMHALAIRNYQKETIKMSANSLVHDPSHTRDISSITMTLDEQSFKDIREILRECRNSIIRKVDRISDSELDRVYQLNLQLIPLTDTRGNG